MGSPALCDHWANADWLSTTVQMLVADNATNLSVVFMRWLHFIGWLTTSVWFIFDASCVTPVSLRQYHAGCERAILVSRTCRRRPRIARVHRSIPTSAISCENAYCAARHYALRWM